MGYIAEESSHQESLRWNGSLFSTHENWTQAPCKTYSSDSCKCHC